jgi:hypothetical protein
MTTRISVTEPSRLLEASRALQAENQRRLQDRTEDGWMQRDATRLVKRGRGFADSLISRAAGQRDPWRGAVPEFERPEFYPVQVRGKRFQVAGAYWRISGGSVIVTTADGLASESFGAGIISAPKFTAAFPGGSYRIVLLFSQEFDSFYKAAVVTRDKIKIVNWPNTLKNLAQQKGIGSSGVVGNFRLLRSYGFGRLVNRQVQDNAYGYTPVMFSYFKNYDDEFLYGDLATNNSKALSYKYIREKYFPADAPQYMLTAGYQQPGVTEDTTENIYYFRSTPVLNAPAFNMSAFQAGTEQGLKLKKNLGLTAVLPVQTNNAIYNFFFLGPENNENYFFYDNAAWVLAAGINDPVPVAAWDWDRPLACLIELQRLGFTASDLMLTPEETAALAAADPAVVGFKF